MADVDFKLMGENVARLLEEQRAMRLELRRLAESQQMTANAIRSLRDELELMIRTEIGGLFAHLETRLEHYIDEAIRERS